jgi:NADPH-dependent glutamate synthase beta subunit-like oxidoreductase
MNSDLSFDVVVIGGGDTAMDCVRTSVRQNAKSVKVDRKLLINLLMDHSLLISSLNDLGVRDIENG